MGIIDGYLFVYLDDLGAPATVMGACLATICAIELPVFMYSGAILNALGHTGALNVALGAFCVRLAAYSVLNFAPSPWFVVPVELLHGLTFGIAWSAGVNYCKTMAPIGLEATAQGLFQSTYAGLGRSFGGLIGGLLYESVGPAIMFRLACLWTCVAWVMIAAVQHVLKRATVQRR